MEPTIDNGRAVNSRCEQTDGGFVQRADIDCDDGYKVTSGKNTKTIECDPETRMWTGREHCTSKTHYGGLQSDTQRECMTRNGTPL